MITQEYAPGRLADVHGDGTSGVVLLWHGRGADSRTVVAGLADEISRHDLRVVAIDWDSGAPDAGRADLLASLEHARALSASLDLDPERLVVVGWSLGGTAAVGLVMQGAELDVRVAATVLLSPGDGPRAGNAFTGEPLPAPMPAAPHAGTVHVVSATHDDIATPEIVRGLHTRLREAGWPTTWTDLDADHGSIAMSRYDAEHDRFVAADDEPTRAVGRGVAEIVAAVATSS